MLAYITIPFVLEVSIIFFNKYAPVGCRLIQQILLGVGVESVPLFRLLHMGSNTMSNLLILGVLSINH